MLWSSGSTWLGMASRPIVAMTAVSASRTGNPAATRLPNASSRIPIVNGIESSPAFFSASAKALLTCSSAVTPKLSTA